MKRTLHLLSDSLLVFWFIRAYVAVCTFAIMCSRPVGAEIFRVDDDAPDGGDGLSWATAFNTIQDAVDAADDDEGGECWVAEGRYSSLTYGIVVTFAENVSLYGGFAGNETVRQQRNWINHQTILDAEYKGTVVRMADGSTLDGFVVTGGLQVGIANYYTSRIVNCHIKDNRGGGVINSCVYTFNIDGEFPFISNCIFSDNWSSGKGGGIYSEGHSLARIYQCTFVDNEALEGNSIYSESGEMDIQSCIFWGKGSEIAGTGISVSHSCVKDGYEGEGNISSDPLLIPKIFKLSPGSPCIDAGTPQPIDLLPVDFGGGDRIRNGRVDIGAYEQDTFDNLIAYTVVLGPEEVLVQEPKWRIKGFYWLESGESISLPPGDYEMEFLSLVHWKEPESETVTVSQSNTDDEFIYTPAWGNYLWFVDLDANGANDGTTWEDAFTDIQSAVDKVSFNGFGEVWVAEGVYTGDGANVLEIKSGVELYGGFAGNETERSQRRWTDRMTRIDGQEERRCILGENDYILDGFTISRGMALDGAGVFNTDGFSRITNCIFANNVAGEDEGRGGAICNDPLTHMDISNCIFFGNIGSMGVCIHNDNANMIMDHCTMGNNISKQGQVAVDNQFSSSFVSNSIIWEASPCIHPTVSTIIENCCVNRDLGGSNVYALPRLDNYYRLLPNSPCIDAGNSDYSTDTTDYLGNNRVIGQQTDIGACEFEFLHDQWTALTVTLGPGEIPSSDLKWRFKNSVWRVNGETVDIYPGEYEIEFSQVDHWISPFIQSISLSAGNTTLHFDYTPVISPPVVYVDHQATGKNDGSSWEHAFTEIQPAVDLKFPEGYHEVWVAEGTYTSTDSQVVALKSGVYLFGGFSGSETVREQRDWVINLTVIDGQNVHRGVLGVGNSILDGFMITNGRADQGAGLLSVGFSQTLRNCLFSRNEADESGGGVYLYNSDDGMAVMEDCIFHLNTALNGGALYVVSEASEKFIPRGCYFHENSATEGGAVYMMDTVFSFEDCSFSANTASSFGGAASIGFDLIDYNLHEGYHSQFLKCSFERNHADQNGGAVYSKYYYTGYEISDSTFSSNSAGCDGGAVYSKKFGLNTVVNSQFISNDATCDGGAVYLRERVADIDSCIFTTNSADRLGGAIMAKFHDTKQSIKRSFFFENESAYGGAICNYYQRESFTDDTKQRDTSYWVQNHNLYSHDITNCLFVRNRAEIKGDGIYNYSERSDAVLPSMPQFVKVKTTPPMLIGIVNYHHYAPKINYCTFVSLPGDQGVESDWPYEHIRDFEPQKGKQIFGTYVEYNWYYYEPEAENCILWTQGDTVNDPMFRDPENDDYRLSAQSIYIDAGEEEGAPIDDIRGLYRPSGEAPDCGAYEYYEGLYSPELIYLMLGYADPHASDDVNNDGLIDSADLLSLR